MKMSEIRVECEKVDFFGMLCSAKKIKIVSVAHIVL